MKNIKYTFILFWLFMSCNKLDIKPDLSRVVPSTLEDFQGILDNADAIFNLYYTNYGEIAGAEFFVAYQDFQSNFTPLTSEVYKWNIADLTDSYFVDWNTSYSKILQCNIVLEGLSDYQLTAQDGNSFNSIKGQALFHRAHSFFMLAEEFAPVYELNNLNKPAIPLRTASDINLKYPISSVEKVYKQIVGDLKLALELLPDDSPYLSRPDKAAGNALLARIYLAMDDYPNALKCANLSLQEHSILLDFNLLDGDSPYPISQFNSEVMFQGSISYDHLLSRNVSRINSSLIDLYELNDLRKKILFFEREDGSFGFKGNYNGVEVNSIFAGIATDEVILIQAECNARLNNISIALDGLNTLLKKRYDNTSFLPVNITNQENLLRRILLERRKELLFRGLRWSDLRRLNKDSRFAVTLTRELNGQTYTLPPNDPRYIFPIPKYVTTITY